MQGEIIRPALPGIPRHHEVSRHTMQTNITQQNIKLRPVKHSDIDGINQVIEAAITTWSLPERVKRLALSSYRYSSVDLDHLEAVVAEDEGQHIIGIAAWEPADAKDAPAGCRALLLHGIYVHPSHQHQGVGARLFEAAEKAVKKQGYDGLLVKAQEHANGFFRSRGMQGLQVEDPARHYANRYWKAMGNHKR